MTGRISAGRRHLRSVGKTDQALYCDFVEINGLTPPKRQTAVKTPDYGRFSQATDLSYRLASTNRVHEKGRRGMPRRPVLITQPFVAGAGYQASATNLLFNRENLRDAVFL